MYPLAFAPAEWKKKILMWLETVCVKAQVCFHLCADPDCLYWSPLLHTGKPDPQRNTYKYILYISVHTEASIIMAPPLPDSGWTGARTQDTLMALSTCVDSFVCTLSFHQPPPPWPRTTNMINNVSSTCLVICVGNEGSAAVVAALRAFAKESEGIHHPLTHWPDLNLMYRNSEILNPLLGKICKIQKIQFFCKRDLFLSYQWT